MQTFTALLLTAALTATAYAADCPNGTVVDNLCCIGGWQATDSNGKKSYKCEGTILKMSDSNYSAALSSATAGLIPTSTWSSANIAPPTGLAGLSYLGLGGAAAAAVYGAM